ncbi:tyrosine-type recombinase/integrase [Streptomyces sp. P9-2]|uniref:tyrosine-type recombinase/integrase n=1 Tax=Streptomyces sp. P9-2 TaxID=3423201 RepID=UPI003F743E93
MAGYIEDRWLKKRVDPRTGKRERTAQYGKGLRYRVKGVPGVGDRSFATSQDAKQWLATVRTDSLRGDFVDPRNGQITLGDYIIDHWWPSRSDEPSTAAPMQSRIRNHILPLLGDLPLAAIDASVLRSYSAALLSRVESSTAEVVWSHLSSILTSAVDDKRLPHNPIKTSRSVKPPRAGKRKAGAWTRSTVEAVREHLPERYQLALDLGLGLGLRQGEVFGLGEEDIDFAAGLVHIRRQVRWNGKGRPYFSLPKGNKMREVPLSPGLAARVQNHLRRFPAAPVTLPWRNPEPPATPLEARQRKPITVRLVLTTQNGNRVYYQAFNNRCWKPALAAAGVIEPVGERATKDRSGRTRRQTLYAVPREHMFHVLRHTYASVQLEAGESVVSLAAWLGHSSSKVTLDHYAHFMPGAGRRGQSVMDAWLGADQPSAESP